MLKVQDLDIIETNNGEYFLACGAIHPKKYIISYPLSFFWNANSSIPAFLSHFCQNSFQLIPKDFPAEKYQKFLDYSPIFDTPLYLVPRTSIRKSQDSQTPLNQLKTLLNSKNLGDLQKISKPQRQIFEILLNLTSTCEIPIASVGILPHQDPPSQNGNTLLHITITGSENFKKVANYHRQAEYHQNRISPWFKLDLLPFAQQLASLSGLSLERCFEFVYRQPNWFQYRKTKIILHFLPNPHEIEQYPGYAPETQMKNIGYVQLTAEIQSLQWNLVFPRILSIKSRSWHNRYDNYKEILKATTRVIICNRNYCYGGKIGDKISIGGILQQVSNIPHKNEEYLPPNYQILIGSPQANTQAEFILPDSE